MFLQNVHWFLKCRGGGGVEYDDDDDCDTFLIAFNVKDARDDCGNGDDGDDGKDNNGNDGSNDEDDVKSLI